MMRRRTALAICIMFTMLGASLRRRGPVVAVTAFVSLSGRTAKSNPTTPLRLFSRPIFGASYKRQNAIARRSTVSETVEATRKVLDLRKGLDTTHPSYDVLQKDIVEEYGAYCTLYRHKKSGAELLSVSVDDDNKVFGITLRTPPEDSTGVPHILEHSVLCGSRKYKTKDPFVHLLKGSLQTFLNAFTYPDRTCYVVASQNEKDFYNLVNVYADAVYQPRAVRDPMVLAQEGWHLEVDDDGKLIYNGVV
jgi:presequence protease